MKYSKYALLALIVACFVFPSRGFSQDVLKIAPEHYIVLTENEHVRVLEVKINPGEKEAMHTHPATIHFPFAPAKVKVGYPDGTFVEREGEAGGAIWVGPEKHTIENIGDTVIHAYIVELKDIPYKEKNQQMKE